MGETADEVIIRLVDDPEDHPKPGDRAKILARMAEANFRTTKRRACELEATYQLIGRPKPSNPAELIDGETRLTEGEAHLIKRIEQKHVRPDAGLEDYLTDIRTAVKHGLADVWVGMHWNREKAATLTPLVHMKILRCVKVNSTESLLVVYSAREGVLLSGHPRKPSTALDDWAKKRHLT